MMASAQSLFSTSAAALFLPLILFAPLITAQDAGDAAADNTRSGGAVDNAAGAAGKSSGAIDLSRGGMIAIILVAVLVGGGGIAFAILFYVAKKRQWEIRKSIRKSARRLTSNFGGVGGQQRAARRQTGLNKLGEVNRQRGKGDLEKGSAATAVTAKTVTPMAPSPLAKKPGFGKKYGR